MFRKLLSNDKLLQNSHHFFRYFIVVHLFPTPDYKTANNILFKCVVMPIFWLSGK